MPISLGIPNFIVKWVSFLCERKQRIKLNGSFFDWVILKLRKGLRSLAESKTQHPEAVIECLFKLWWVRVPRCQDARFANQGVCNGAPTTD